MTQGRSVGHMEIATTDFSSAASVPVRRCRRCGAYLSASNADKTCFPCQRTEMESLWTSASHSSRGAVLPRRSER